MDGVFNPTCSSNDIWYDTNLEECLTTHIEGIESDISALETGKADTNHTHTGYATANHTHNEYAAVDHTHTGYAAASDVTALQTLVGDTAVSTQISTAVSGKADTNHTHSEYANQNTFSNVIVGTTTIAADTVTDTLTLAAGSNITLTPDTANDKITISATDTVYTHPTTSGNKHIPSGGVSGQILRWSADGAAVWGTDNNTTYSVATTSANGLMSSADKTKLDGIASGANNIVVDSELSTTSTNPVQNKVVNTAINNLSTLVGDTSVSSQIASAISNINLPVKVGTGTSSIIEGELTKNSASGNYSHSEGRTTSAVGAGAHAEGGNLSESGTGTMISLTISKDTYPMIGDTDIVMDGSTAYGVASHAEGTQTFAFGYNSHAEGNKTRAMARNAHVEGYSSVATGDYSHAEGKQTVASAESSHAEGALAKATGKYSHAEGSGAKAYGIGAHGEGGGTTASGYCAHSEGRATTASGDYSHAAGMGTTASRMAQYVYGYYNIEDTVGTDGTVKGKYLNIVGNGLSEAQHSNAYTLDWDGNGWFAGTVEGTALILKSSTSGSTKRFKITVNDSGTLTATEIT